MTLRVAARRPSISRPLPPRRRPRLWQRVWHAIVGNVVISVCALFIVAIVLLALVVSLLPLADPTAQSVIFRLKPPSPEHVFGTDRLGRDILSRVLWGSRVSLAVGVGVVALSAVLGTALGTFAGYVRGWPSELVLRLIDIFLAFPPLILAMVTVTLLPNNLPTVILAISVGTIPRFARVTRGTIPPPCGGGRESSSTPLRPH